MAAETRGWPRAAAYRYVAQKCEIAVRRLRALELGESFVEPAPVQPPLRGNGNGRADSEPPAQEQEAGGGAEAEQGAPMKVFVTGGTGFLGQALIARLVEKGIAVRAMVRDKRARVASGAEPVEVGFEDKAKLAEALKGSEAIFHLAGKVSRDPVDAAAMHWIHVEATKTLLDAAESAKVRRIVLASTSGTIAVRKNAGRPITEAENAPLEIIGRWPYYMSKTLQEQEVLRRDKQDRIEAVVLNPSLLLGPGDERLSSVNDVLRILHGRMPAITEGTMAIVDVRDVAPMFEAALEKGRRGQRYLLNGSNLGVRAFAERVARAGEVSMPLLRLSKKWAVTGAKLIEGLYQAAERTPPIDAVTVEMGCHHWGCSAEKAKAELGFTARDPQDTIRDTVRDLEQRGLFRR
jgi:dihydroflavonol-4-reductase